MRTGRQPQRKGGKSPITKKIGNVVEMHRNGVVANTVKINRIPLLRTCIVELLSVESPSCIWVRLLSHITHNLVVTNLHELEKCTDDIQLYDYFLAPIEQNVFARCRVLKKKEFSNSVKVLVFFIDHGTKAWIDRDVLAKMPLDDLPYHPWQAICISIHSLSMPGNKAYRANVDPSWSEEHRNELTEIMNEFSCFKTKTYFSSVYCDDYREPNKVELFGLRDKFDQRGVSIAHLFAARIGDLSVVPIKVFDSSLVKPIDNIPDKSFDRSYLIPDFQNSWPHIKPKPLDQNELHANYNWELWKPEIAEIPYITPDWLKKNGYFREDGSLYLSVEGAFTMSPYEWYARPVKPTYSNVSESDVSVSTGVREIQLMLKANDELRAKAEILDSFYSEDYNRHTFEKNLLRKWLSNGKRVYGIYGTFEDRAPFTGEWQRVEILTFDESCEIRFLDSGGRDHVIVGQLYKIHPSHCKYPPLCGQFLLHGCRDSDERFDAGNGQWSVDCRQAWKRILRADSLVTAKKIALLNMEYRGLISQTKIPLPFQEEHVLYVSGLSCKQKSLEVAFTSNKPHGAAVTDTQVPFPWPNDVVAQMHNLSL